MRVADLRSILRYVPKFREGVFVVSLGGDVIASENFQNILLDLAVLRSLNINVLIVHSATHRIQELGKLRHIRYSDFVEGEVTDEATLNLAIDATSRQLNVVLQGLTAVDLRAASPNAVVAAPAGIRNGVDTQLTGRVQRVEVAPIELFLAEGIVPVISPLGYDAEGNCYRLNSDDLAVALAKSLRAAKIIFLTTSGLECAEGNVVRNLSIVEAQQILRGDSFTGTPVQRSKLAAAAAACAAGVPRVHILPGTVDGAMLNEVFSSDGIGTMVYADDYQNIRAMEKRDIRAVLDLVRQSVDSAELVRRTRVDFVNSLSDYWVLETDGLIMGCVALHSYPEQEAGELACLYIKPNYTNRGYGRKLIQFVENLAARRGIKWLFALSTQTFSFFEQKGGYKEVASEMLPPTRRRKYEESKRNSKVLLKPLASAEPAIAMQNQAR